MDDQTPTQPQHPPSGRSSLSPLAVIGVVLASIPMCVPVNLLGFVFGALALRRIRHSGGVIRGRNVARAAMIIGLVTTIGGSWGWMRLGQWQEKATAEAASLSVNGFVTSATAGDVTAAMQWWSPQTAAPKAQDVLAFGKAINATCDVTHVTVNAITSTTGGDFWKPTMSLWLTVVCNDGQQCRASARIDLIPRVGQLQPQSGIRWIEVTLPSGMVSVGTPPDDASTPEP